VEAEQIDNEALHGLKDIMRRRRQLDCLSSVKDLYGSLFSTSFLSLFESLSLSFCFGMSRDGGSLRIYTRY